MFTSSTVSSCGVAALSSESFWEPASALLRTSLLFLCLWASFLTCPSAFPLLRRLTGLVSHFLKVLPGRLGPGELWAPIMWGWSDVTEAGGLASLLETERESGKKNKGSIIKLKHQQVRNKQMDVCNNGHGIEFMEKSMRLFWGSLAFNDTTTISVHVARGRPRLSTTDVLRTVKLH